MTARKSNIITALFIVTGLFFIINSCKDEEIYTIGIDLTNTYSHDQVQIKLDGEVVIDEPLQTDLSTGLATGRRVKKSSGIHTLKVTVNDVFSKTETISLGDDLYIDVRYIPATHEISFKYSDRATFYD